MVRQAKKKTQLLIQVSGSRSVKVITTSESQTGGGKRSVHIHSGTPFNNRNLEHAKKEPSFKGAD